MSHTIIAIDHLESKAPGDEGARLADLLLDEGDDLCEFAVDLRAIKPALLISVFFNAFLQRIFDRLPESLPNARQVTWVVPYEFQRRHIKRLMSDFSPFDEQS